MRGCAGADPRRATGTGRVVGVTYPVPMPEPSAAPVFAVSTVMDNPEHVRRYVEGNLAGGVDHLVVFLDKPRGPRQDEVAAYLDAQPAVTCVRAGKDWWADARPRELNERQCTNANLAKDVLADLGHGDAWLFHVDGDEVVRVSSGLLGGLPREAAAVRLPVREAVSTRQWDGEPTLFKRELPEGDLRLLHGLGLIAEPTNQAYFRGHLMGKSGVRVGATAWLGLHRVLGDDGRELQHHEDDDSVVFHYESYSAEEFVRKWTAMVASGPKASFRPDRQPVARTMRALINRGLEPEALERQLVRFYERAIEEDVESLRDLAVLVEADPLAPRADDARRPSVDGAALAAGIEARRSEVKQRHFKGTSAADAQRRGSEESSGRGLSRLVRRSRSSSSESSDLISERR